MLQCQLVIPLLLNLFLMVVDGVPHFILEIFELFVIGFVIFHFNHGDIDQVALLLEVHHELVKLIHLFLEAELPPIIELVDQVFEVHDSVVLSQRLRYAYLLVFGDLLDEHLDVLFDEIVDCCALFLGPADSLFLQIIKKSN